ncbi:MAG: hypothetical protein EHM21_05505, partial [Chloroflexi bacterium]
MWSFAMRREVANDRDLVPYLAELQKSISRYLSLIFGGVYFLFLAVTAITPDQQYNLRVWLAVPLIFLTIVLSLRYLDSNFVLAQVIWLSGFTLIVVAQVVVWQQPVFGFALALAPFLGFLLLSRRAGVLAELVIIGLAIFLGSLEGGSILPRDFVLGVTLGSIVSGLL